MVRRTSGFGPQTLGATLRAPAAELPPVWVRCGTWLLATLVGRVLGVRRRHAEVSMARAGINDAARVAQCMYRQLARGVFELLWLWLSPRRVLATVDLGPDPGGARVSGPGFRLTVPPRVGIPAGGGVIATAHTGNWDLVACAAAQRWPLAIITKRLSVRWLDRWWQTVRVRSGARLLDIGHARRGAQAHLARGGYVASLIDQAPERRRGVVVGEFLRAEVHVDLAPALLAMRARVPLAVAFPRRVGRWRHELVVTSVHVPPAFPSRDWAEQTMLQATRELERFVLEQPDQWLWMHRRWKPPPAEVRGRPKPTLGDQAEAPDGCRQQDFLPGE